MHRRFWPQKESPLSKSTAFLKKKKENYLLRVKLLYTSFFVKKNQKNVLSAGGVLPQLTSRLAVARRKATRTSNLSKQNTSTDLSRKFLEIL